MARRRAARFPCPCSFPGATRLWASPSAPRRKPRFLPAPAPAGAARCSRQRPGAHAAHGLEQLEQVRRQGGRRSRARHGRRHGGSGMKDAGYIYINIDDTWEGRRDAQGNITGQQEISRHEGAGRLRPLQGVEDRHLLLARPQDLRRLRRQLRPRRSRTPRPTPPGASII